MTTTFATFRSRCWLAAPAIALSLNVWAGPSYTVIDLGALGGVNVSYPMGINQNGRVVGYTVLANNGIGDRATLFSGSGGANLNLGTLGGANGYAYSINGSGGIVGYAYTTAGAPHATQFIVSGGSNVDLGTLGGFNSAAQSINNGGQVVGEAYTTGNAAVRATLFSTSGGPNVDLGTLGGKDSSAFAINDNGQVVGYAADVNGANRANRATLFSTTGGANIDLGKLANGDFSIAYAVSNSGQVVGETYTPYSQFQYLKPWAQRATLFSTSGGTPVDLGTLGGTNSRAWDNNNLDQVVGMAQLASQEWDAFIWQNGVMTSLESLIDPTSGWNFY